MENTSIFSWTFWSGTKARTALENGLMSDRLKFKYYILFISSFVLSAELVYLAGYGSENVTYTMNTFDVVLSFCTIALTLGGTYYLYTLHRVSVSPASFIEKIVIISVAAAPWLILIAIIPTTIIFAIVYVIVYPESTTTTYLDVIGILVPQILYYYFLSSYFVQTSERLYEKNNIADI